MSCRLITPENYRWRGDFKPLPNEKTFHEIASSTNFKVLSTMITESPEKCNEKNELGRTPMMLAALNGRKENIKILLEAGADLSLRDCQEQTVLHYAAHSGNADVLKMLLEVASSELIKAQDKFGQTILHLYCDLIHPKKDSLEFLLQQQDLVNMEDLSGLTPAMLAASRLHGSILAELIPITGDLNRKSNSKETLLTMLADTSELIAIEYVRLAVAYGAHIEQLKDVDLSGWEDMKETIEELEAMADFTDFQKLSWTLEAEGFHYVSSYLEKNGYPVNEYDRDGNCFLHYIIEFGNCELLDLALRLGGECDIHHKNNKEETPVNMDCDGRSESLNMQGKLLRISASFSSADDGLGLVLV